MRELRLNPFVVGSDFLLLRLLMSLLLWSMGLLHLLRDGLLFLLRLILLLATTTLVVVWKERTPVPVVSALVGAIVKEEWNMVIVIVVHVVVLVGCTHWGQGVVS